MDEGNGNPDLPAWEANAEHWDDYMGDDSNEWHRDLVRPGVTALLDPHPGERILDIACGNGNYSAYLADMGAMVTAFDFSPRMVGLARRRRQHTMVPVDFRVADASDAEDISSLGEPGGFDKAVCNMGFMDISDIGTLLAGVHRLLAPGGTLVFATQHPLRDPYGPIPHPAHLSGGRHPGTAGPPQLPSPFPPGHHGSVLRDGIHRRRPDGDGIPGKGDPRDPHRPCQSGTMIPDGGRWWSSS